jgi:hypothetical protein
MVDMSTDLHKDTTSTSPAPGKKTEWHVALLGGWRRAGGAAAPSRAVSVAVIGGANIDFHASAFPAEGTTIVKVGLVGGLDVTVPEGTRVEIRHFRIIGGRKIQLGPETPGGPVLRIRAFTAVGGIHVHTY